MQRINKARESPEWEMGDLNICAYWRGQYHRYLFSVNYGEKHFETSEAKGKEIIRFLNLLTSHSPMNEIAD